MGELSRIYRARFPLVVYLECGLSQSGREELVHRFVLTWRSQVGEDTVPITYPNWILSAGTRQASEMKTT